MCADTSVELLPNRPEPKYGPNVLRCSLGLDS